MSLLNFNQQLMKIKFVLIFLFFHLYLFPSAILEFKVLVKIKTFEFINVGPESKNNL